MARTSDWELLTVAIENNGESGSVLVCTGGQGRLRLSLLTPILDRLGVEILSFDSRGVSTASGQKQTMMRYVINDGAGHSLQGPIVMQLIEALQRELHVEVVSYDRALAGALAEEPEHGTAGGQLHGPGAKRPENDTSPPAEGSMQQQAAAPHAAADLDDPKHNAQRTRNLPKTVSWAPGTPFSPASSGDLASTSGIGMTAADSLDHRQRLGSEELLPSGSERGSGDSRQPSSNSCTSQNIRGLPAAGAWPIQPASSWEGSPFSQSNTAALAATSSEDVSPSGPRLRPLFSIPSEDPDTPSLWGSCISPTDPVSLIMSQPLRWISQEANLGEARKLMTNWGISSLMVDTGTAQPGFLTMRGFLNVSFSKSLKKTQVKDVMTQPVIYVTPDTGIEDCLQVMQNTSQKVRRVGIFDPQLFNPDNPETWNCSWVGMVSDTDIFRCLGQPKRCEDAETCMQRYSPGPGAAPSMCPSNFSLAPSNSSRSTLSSMPQYSCSFSTEDRYRAAAALWELDFSELEMIRKIGEGSFGEVTLANFRGTKVAVKRLRGFETQEEGAPSTTIQPVLNQFFEREIEILATIRHPNVVNFIGACHTPPNICLVTEFCARGSLDKLLHKSALQLDLVKRVEIALDIARGMSALHAQKPPIIHRDMKAANLLVSARLEVKVADFGLSRIKDHAQLVNSRAGLEGTVEYCAPEVLRGEPYTEKCDVYSYGVVCWELFNRQRPYADADIPIFLLMISLGNGNLRLPPLTESVSSHGLVKLWERCMAWQPHDRPSFREVLHALENEHKVVRGKAAAVPRSDSAWCMAGKDQEPDAPDNNNMASPGHVLSPACFPAMPLQPRPLAADANHALVRPPGVWAPASHLPPPAPPKPSMEPKPRSLSRRMNRSTSTPVPEQMWFDSDGNIIEEPAMDTGGSQEVGPVQQADGSAWEEAAGSSRRGDMAGLGAGVLGFVDEEQAVPGPSTVQQEGQAPHPDTAGPVGDAAAAAKSSFAAFASPFGAFPAFDSLESNSTAARSCEEPEALGEAGEPEVLGEPREPEPAGRHEAGQLQLQMSGRQRSLGAAAGHAYQEPAAAPAPTAAGTVPGTKPWLSPFAMAGVAQVASSQQQLVEDLEQEPQHTESTGDRPSPPDAVLHGFSSERSLVESSGISAPRPPPSRVHSPSRSSSPCPSRPLHAVLVSRREPTYARSQSSFSSGVIMLSPQDTGCASCESPVCMSPHVESTLHTTSWVVI